MRVLSRLVDRTRRREPAGCRERLERIAVEVIYAEISNRYFLGSLLTKPELMGIGPAQARSEANRAAEVAIQNLELQLTRLRFPS